MSASYTFADRGSGLGGWVRLGRTEMTTCLYLPDGRVAFWLDRHDAGGLRFEVVHTGDHSYPVDGEVWSSIPLRNRRHGRTTRIVEGMTRWRHGDLEGAGLAEYLDQV